MIVAINWINLNEIVVRRKLETLQIIMLLFIEDLSDQKLDDGLGLKITVHENFCSFLFLMFFSLSLS